jgi:GIY-YIG catalytic domain
VSALPGEAAGSSLIQEVSDWAGKSKACLYYFECRSTSIDLARVERTFASAKARKAHHRAYPRFNAQGTCFYVGSSQSVARRFKEHLGFGASKTYALQLVHWARPLSLELDFVCAKYAENTRFEVIQALEDTLWETRKPMFGRQGRR